VKKLLDLTRRLAADNPGHKFFVDVDAQVAGAKHPETGEIFPIISGLIDGSVAAYHGALVDGKAPEHVWRSLGCFEARYETVKELNADLSEFAAVGHYPLEGVDRIVVGSGASERVFLKHLYGDYGPFTETE